MKLTYRGRQYHVPAQPVVGMETGIQSYFRGISYPLIQSASESHTQSVTACHFRGVSYLKRI
jgi:hypothetical protein